MKRTVLEIPYGKKFLKLTLASRRLLGVLRNPMGKAGGIKKLLSDSLEASPAKERLLTLTRNKKKALVVVPDRTRNVHLEEILPGFLRRLKKNSSCKIDIIVATGLHKKQNALQLRELVGDVVLKHYRVFNHEQDEGSLTNFGFTKGGIPIILNKMLERYDLIVSVGVIEPHLYAGYSGGAKTIAIGLAAEETISATHSVDFLDNPLTRIGSIDDNPFQDALWEIADKLRIRFSLNVVNDPEGRPAKIFSGDIREVFEDGVAFAKSIFEIEVDEPSNLVICGIGSPKDINLYQASRAINYILNDRPIIKKGGLLLVVAELKDGFGDGLSEQRFYNKLKNMASPKDFVMRAKREGCIAGEHRAYMVAKAMVDYNIIFVGKGQKTFMSNLPFKYFEDIHEALGYADSIVGEKSKIYVIPRALSTIARLRSS